MHICQCSSHKRKYKIRSLKNGNNIYCEEELGEMNEVPEEVSVYCHRRGSRFIAFFHFIFALRQTQHYNVHHSRYHQSQWEENVRQVLSALQPTAACSTIVAEDSDVENRQQQNNRNCSVFAFDRRTQNYRMKAAAPAELARNAFTSARQQPPAL